MNVLAVNCGSSTLKFRLLEIDPSDAEEQTVVRGVASGVVDRIGREAKVDFISDAGDNLAIEREVLDHGEATRLALDWLGSLSAAGVDAVGHRVVHGGSVYTEPVLIGRSVISRINALGDLAPLHNAPALASILAARETLGPSAPMVATFDTSFFRALPERASQYAIPRELTQKHAVRRYGFHGLAHSYMAERYAAMTSSSVEGTRLVTVHLGNGCSATAIEGGRPVDTSMGFTPLEGLVMGTRSGDIDPAVVAHLQTAEGVNASGVLDWLNTKSGLLGLSGRSSDMRELLAAEAAGDQRAALAIELFCYRVKKYVGAYLAALDGADALVFGGGIGENAPAVRARICAGMEWCGVTLDPDRNEATVGSDGRITADNSEISVHVVAVDEELMIARDTVRCIGS